MVILGDTSAGKSSLVNLLIEKDLLPCEVLSTSTAITKLFNSKEKKAKVTDENGKQIQINNPTMETLNQYIARDLSEQNTKRYKSVDISWPVPLLKVNRVFCSILMLYIYSFLIHCIIKQTTDV